jgi:hypothetical protein
LAHCWSERPRSRTMGNSRFRNPAVVPSSDATGHPERIMLRRSRRLLGR